MKTLKSLFILPILASSCILIHTDDSIDLGNNYRYIQDTPQVIVYHKTHEYKGVGVNIVPPLVKSYAFNDRYIIAKSKEVDEMTGVEKRTPFLYWLIDKTRNGIEVEPMDSLAFYNKIIEQRIYLKLK